MTLLKITHVIQDAKSDYDPYETENIIWNSIGYRAESIIKNGISINCRYCVEYIDDSIYIDLDKLNDAKMETLGYNPGLEYITYVVLDEMSVVFVGDEDIIKRYRDAEIDAGLSVELTVEEWMIKKLLE